MSMSVGLRTIGSDAKSETSRPSATVNCWSATLALLVLTDGVFAASAQCAALPIAAARRENVIILFLNRELIADFAVRIVRPVHQAVAVQVDVEHLIRGKLREANLGVFVRHLLVMLGPRNRDDVNRSIFGAGRALLSAHRIGPQVGVVVALQGEVHVIFVENRGPAIAHLGVVAVAA